MPQDEKTPNPVRR